MHPIFYPKCAHVCLCDIGLSNMQFIIRNLLHSIEVDANSNIHGVSFQNIISEYLEI